MKINKGALKWVVLLFLVLLFLVLAGCVPAPSINEPRPPAEAPPVVVECCEAEVLVRVFHEDLVRVIDEYGICYIHGLGSISCFPHNGGR